MGAGLRDPGLGGQDQRALLGRAAWSFVAQTVSSASNFLLSVLILSVATAREFAVFAVCLTSYAFLLQLTRATVGVPVTLLHSDGAGQLDDAEQRAAVGTSVAAGLVIGAVALLAAGLTSSGRMQLIVLGAALPFLMWQDTVRYVCFARGRPSTAAGADCLWVALQIAGSAVLFAVGRPSAVTLLAVWAASGTVSAFYVGVRLQLAPRLRAAAQWATMHRALCSRLLAEFLVAAGSHYSVYYGLAIVAGAEQLGRVKAAQTLLGPVVVLLQGGGQLGVPESVRAAHDPGLLRRIAARLGLVLAAGSLACGVVIFVALPSVGPVVFPKAWATARPLLPALTAFCVALGVSTGATAALRALGATPWLLRLRAQSGAVLVVLGLVASATLHATGALLSVTVVEGTVAVLAWRRLLLLTTGAATTLEPDDSTLGDDRRRGRSLPGADEAGADPVRAGGGLPPLDVLEGLGPGPLHGPAPPPARPGAGAGHP